MVHTSFAVYVLPSVPFPLEFIYVEAGSNTSAAALGVVEGDETGIQCLGV
jgi:hypothetical protein